MVIHLETDLQTIVPTGQNRHEADIQTRLSTPSISMVKSTKSAFVDSY